MKTEKCTRCNDKLSTDIVWLELNKFTGLYYKFNEVPIGESQGSFPFGVACSKEQLKETATSHQTIEGETMTQEREAHIKKVSEWILSVNEKQGRDMGEGFFVETYPKMFKIVLSNEGVKVTYQETINALREVSNVGR